MFVCSHRWSHEDHNLRQNDIFCSHYCSWKQKSRVWENVRAGRDQGSLQCPTGLNPQGKWGQERWHDLAQFTQLVPSAQMYLKDTSLGVLHRHIIVQLNGGRPPFNRIHYFSSSKHKGQGFVQFVCESVQYKIPFRRVESFQRTNDKW